MDAVRLATLLQLTLPGAPCIYYGDEIGLDGGHDPGCREGMPWPDEAAEAGGAAPDAWDEAVFGAVQALVALRRRHAALRRGAWAWLGGEGRVGAFARWLAPDPSAADAAADAAVDAAAIAAADEAAGGSVGRSDGGGTADEHRSSPTRATPRQRCRRSRRPSPTCLPAATATYGATTSSSSGTAVSSGLRSLPAPCCCSAAPGRSDPSSGGGTRRHGADGAAPVSAVRIGTVYGMRSSSMRPTKMRPRECAAATTPVTEVSAGTNPYAGGA